METNFIGKIRIFLPEVNSTNSYAIELLKNVKPMEGTLIHTQFQTAGRGQRGMLWNAEPTSNLTFSLIIKPQFLMIEKSFYLYKIAALACYDALTEILKKGQFDIKIKWPNDILVNKKKICGILIENVLFNNQLNWSVIGIGINVNQNYFEANLNATSIIQLLGEQTNIDQLLSYICFYFERHYLLLKDNQLNKIDELYFFNLFGVNEYCWVEQKGKRLRLKVNAISPQGLLVLKDENESIFEVDVKDIKWLLNE